MILGTDLSDLCASDLQMLENTAVIALDQDRLVASPVYSGRPTEIVSDAR